MIAKAAPPGLLGFDTVATLTTEMVKRAHDAGARFAMRYLPSLHPAEVAIILGGGLALTVVGGYSRAPGWVPSKGAGVSDGQLAVLRARIAGLPTSPTVWCDFEGAARSAPTADHIDYLNAWAGEVAGGGYDPGLYAGYDTGLTSEELYALRVDKYTHSCSRVVDLHGNEAAPACGWVGIQLSPGNVTEINGTDVGFQLDLLITQRDYRNRAVMMIYP